MKKIIYILLSLLIMGSASFAQTQDKGTPKAKPATSQKAPAKGPAKTKEPKEAKPVKTKKDGTADMRYKENKKAAKPTQKLKKDGTPDMRYKANKDAAKKK